MLVKGIPHSHWQFLLGFWIGNGYTHSVVMWWPLLFQCYWDILQQNFYTKSVLLVLWSLLHSFTDDLLCHLIIYITLLSTFDLISWELVEQMVTPLSSITLDLGACSINDDTTLKEVHIHLTCPNHLKYVSQATETSFSVYKYRHILSSLYFSILLRICVKILISTSIIQSYFFNYTTL